MANEITLNAELSLRDSEMGETVSVSIEDLLKSISTKRYTRIKQNVGITEEALNLGDLSALGWAIIVNRDVTNFVSIKTGTGGTIFAKLVATNGFALFHFGSGVTAPFVIADTAACQIESFIINT